MASPPPLIRSSKPFSVEIPEGSNSAKARRSDVVGSDELSISAKKSNFKTSDAALVPEMHHESAADLSDRFSQHTDSLFLQDAHLEDGSVPQELHLGHEDSRNDPNIQNVGGDTLQDREIDLPPADPLKVNLQHIDEDTYKDNLQALPSSSPLKDNLQAVHHESLKDNLQEVNEDPLNKNLQALPSSSPLEDNLQVVHQESLKDNLQEVTEDPLSNNLQEILDGNVKDRFGTEQKGTLDADVNGLPKDSLKDRTVGESNNSFQDRQASDAKDALADNLQGSTNNALKSNHQDVDKPSIVDNNASLPSEALENRTSETDKKHLHDHAVALPDAHYSPKNGSQSTQFNKPSHSNAASHQALNPKITASIPAKVSAKVLSPTALSHLQAAKSEQARKTEEFHGRVEALKKTVSGINHLLDELEEKKSVKKS